jgi:ubiquinone/menaquinone biosynthesis C-methylase UbiE
MKIAGNAQKPKGAGMSNLSFRLMSLAMSIVDLVTPKIDTRVATFGIKEGMTVVDYGCGPGRYTTRFARLAGASGKVYAVDIHPLAIETVKVKAAKEKLANITPVLAEGYSSGIPDHVADVVCAIDMFRGIKEPSAFLTELRRIAKPDGMLIIDDGHQPRAATKAKIQASGQWVISAETPDHLTCTPAP